MSVWWGIQPFFFRVAVLVTVILTLAGCAGHVSVPQAVALKDTRSWKPALRSNGTERIKIPKPNLDVRLPAEGDPFLYDLTVTKSLEAFYRAITSGQKEGALQILEEVERSTSDGLMRYAVALLRVQLLIVTGRWDEAEKGLDLLDSRERGVFGKNLETTSLRGELELWRGNLKAARVHYTQVLAAIGEWRVPTFYMRPPSNNNEIIYFGRAQLRANIGLVGVLILEGEDESALAWAVAAEERFLDILGLTGHMIYGKYMRATPDLYTSHGWSLAFLAAARGGYSRNLEASEGLFQDAKDYFAIEGQIDGNATADAVREYVLLKRGLVKAPTFRIGRLPEPSLKEPQEWLKPPDIAETKKGEERAPSIPDLPQSFLKLPRSGEQSVFGFRIIPEYDTAFQAYLKGDGEQALAVLGGIDSKNLEPAVAWSLSFLRAQVLIMMGRAADAEEELEHTEEWEHQAFGTNLNARSLRGEARIWLGDYDAAIADFVQVIEALGSWRLPTSYVFPPADVSQLALRSRAQLRAYGGMASALIYKREYALASQWAMAAEDLFQDLFALIQHPLYHHYMALDADMIYGRGFNLGILGAGRLVLTKNVEGGRAFFDAAKKYFDALGFPLGKVTVEAFRLRALFDLGETELAESLAEELAVRAVEKGFSDLLWQFEALLGEILLADGRKEEAEMAFRRAQAAVDEVSGSLASDRSKRRFGLGKEDITYRLVERDVEKGKWEDLFRDLEQGRARAFADMLSKQQMAASREELAVKEIREWDRKIRRQRLLNASPKGASVEGKKIEKEWLNLRNQKVQELRQRDPEMADALSIFTDGLSEIRQHLAPGEVMVYALPARSEEKMRFLIIDSRAARLEISALSQEQLRKSLKFFHSLHPNQEANVQKQIVAQLGEDLRLRDWGVKTLLYVVPSGELYFVPWGALDIDYPVVVLPMGSWLKRSPKVVPAKKTASVIADPETGGAFPKLPGAREEAKTVSQIYGISMLAGEMATEEALRHDIGNGVGVLHFATHGVFDDKIPLNSAVILSTGKRPHRLTAAELFENPLPATLVVLSACETGLGKAVAGDDFLGLARSFYLGGALAVVHSLWPIHDLPTRLFMEEFHRHAVSGDYGKAWLQSRTLLKDKGYPPSIYGAFVLGGQKMKVPPA